MHFAWSAAVGAAFAALYLALAPHVTGPKDAAEFTLVLALNGVPHPTGYPLYVLLGHPFVRLLHALGANWAYAANAWSAVGGGVAVALLHALAARMVPPRAPLGRTARFVAGLVPAAVLGVNPIWLLDAMFAETYTWHLAWVCVAGLFTLSVLREPGGAGDRGELTRRAAAWGVICGVGLAHHLTSVLMVAVFSAGIVVALARARRWSAGFVPAAAAGAAVPLLAYGFVAWRAFHPAAYQWPTLGPEWAGIFAHLRGSAYGDLLGRFAPDEVQGGLLAAHAYPVLFPALALGAAAVAMSHKERLVPAVFSGAAGVQALYAFNYGVRDPSCYFQPALALGLLSVPALAGGLAGRAPMPRAAALGAAALALAGIVTLGARGLPLGWAFRFGAEETDRRIRALWGTVPPGPGFLLWDHDMATTFQVYRLLEGRRPELFAGNPADLSWPVPRRAFRARYGFDPLAGLEPLTAERAVRIPDNMNRQTPLPVTVLDLQRRQVTTLPKP